MIRTILILLVLAGCGRSVSVLDGQVENQTLAHSQVIVNNDQATVNSAVPLVWSVIKADGGESISELAESKFAALPDGTIFVINPKHTEISGFSMQVAPDGTKTVSWDTLSTSVAEIYDSREKVYEWLAEQNILMSSDQRAEFEAALRTTDNLFQALEAVGLKLVVPTP